MPLLRRSTIVLAVLSLALVWILARDERVELGPPPIEEIVAQPVDPSFVFGAKSAPIDTLAATVVTDVQDYWRGAFPTTFDRAWHDLDGGFFAVDTTDTGTEPPPCTADVHELSGNAYYCATVDAIAWDRSALLPVLRDHYGQSAVVVVLAHEMGHAVWNRMRPANEHENAVPPIVLESAADCFAGSYLRWVRDGHSDRLSINEAQLDDALHALLGFGDPRSQKLSNTHGSAFDRAAAFQDGYFAGPGKCSDIGVDRDFVTANTDALPNRGVSELLRVRVPVIRRFFEGVADPDRSPPGPSRSREAPDSRCESGSAGAAVRVCDNGRLEFDRSELSRISYEFGDRAVETLIAARFANATLRDDSTAPRGAAACLTGAYTAASLHQQHGYTAADLDEAVRVLLTRDAPDGPFADDGRTGFQSLRAFRVGVSGGPRACAT